MGIDFWYYVQWQDKDGEWITVDLHRDGTSSFPELETHETFKMHFSERGFYKSEMARILGYPDDAYDERANRLQVVRPVPKDYVGLCGEFLFFRTLDQLEGIFRSKRIQKQIVYEDYKHFRLFLASLRMDQIEYKWRNVRLVVATDFT